MKSIAQLRHEGQGEVPQPPPIQVDPSAVASSSQTMPLTFNIEAAFAQLMSTMESLQREVSLIGECVEQSQIDIRECLKYHHPKFNDDEDWEFSSLSLFVLILLLLFKNNLSLWDFVYFYTNGEYFLFLDLECISKPVKWFLFQNGQKGSLLVFYIGNIPVDKNTLCNDCFLTGLSVLFKVFM
jgi:hypothetical protein